MQNKVRSHALLTGALACSAALLCWATIGASSAAAQNRMLDTDGDGLNDAQDNCVLVSNADQRDTDEDDFGNVCDTDINNDGVTNAVDLGLLRTVFFSADEDADFNGDGAVNATDLGIMRTMFFMMPGPSGVAAANAPLALTRVFTGVSLNNPMAMRQTPDNPDRWYVLQRRGQVISFSNVDDASDAHTVVDLSAVVDTTFEGGALGFDFHPDFANNGYMYVSYTADGPIGSALVSRISRLELTENAQGLLVADPADEVILISVNQPFANHNGGNVLFGPDGYLYWGLGDGGSGGDPQNHGQRIETRLGAMLRIDVDVSQADFDNGVRYYIPPGNVFASSSECNVTTGCPEIYAYGLRNPWRFSFDKETGDLWLGDVGQNAREEIDVVVSGGNYGWRCREGEISFNSSGCDAPGAYEEPIYDYTHSVGFSVTGGYVYRGNAIPAFKGMYVFGDYGSGTIWGIYNGTFAGTLLNTGLLIGSFAEGLDGELYVLDARSNGSVRRIDPAP